MASAWLLLTIFLTQVFADQYILGKQGQSCYATCLAYNLNCAGQIQTNNSTDLFSQLGVTCKTGGQDNWNAQGQPAYITDTNDPLYGYCVGFVGVPNDVMCGGNTASSSRLCFCTSLRDAADPSAFGTGISAGTIPTQEFEVFQWLVPNGVVGVMTHFWITSYNQLENCTIRYYVDGETVASIAYQPGLASGTGFADSQAPWGTKWIGKGADHGSWFNNIRIPFQKSIRVTWQMSGSVQLPGSYIIIRGAPNVPISIGGVPIPTTARLVLYVNNVQLNPLDYLDVVNIPAGKSGLFFFHTLAVQSGNMNFLEGCYRYYSPPDQPYPGTLISTGTEDYYDSGWYFSAGEFHLDVSGYTHYDTNNGVSLSAYRFHETDPLQFSDGFRFVWRNGDANDPKTGLKCFIESGGNVVGAPTVSNVTTYAWVYLW